MPLRPILHHQRLEHAEKRREPCQSVTPGRRQLHGGDAAISKVSQGTATMTEYNFTLTYRLADDDCDPDALVERLGEAGCTDALLGIGTTGRLALDFVRDRETAELA